MPLSPQELLFYAFAIPLVGASLAVILVRNPVFAALFLILAFVSSACLWVLLEAEFLGIALVLVYVGAVMVLFLFVVMMLDINVATMQRGYTSYWPLGLLVAAMVVAEILIAIRAVNSGLDLAPITELKPEGYSNTRELGELLYTQYIYPFEIAGVVLLVGIVAAIALTMRHRGGTRTQDPAQQVRVRASDRVRVVKVAPSAKR
jgi:NADH-quinone oxidoreductase subunit J